MARQNTIIKTLMERDEMTHKEAEGVFLELQAQFYAYLDEGDISSAYDILYEIDLEPDYVMELM